MFEAAEVGHTVSKEAYKKEEARLRTSLLALQNQLAESDRSLVIIVSGAEGAGKEETVDLLLEWIDARGIQTHAMWETTDEERQRPRFWRFWRVLPPKGKIAILFGSWYTEPIIGRVYGKIDDAMLERQMHRVVEFERMLAHEGVTVLKFWLHLSKPMQKKRLKKLFDNPRTRWRVSDMTWKFFKKYDTFRKVSEGALRQTSTGFSPWHIVDASDDRYRALTVMTAVQKTMEEIVSANGKPKATAARKTPLPRPQANNIIRQLDLNQKYSKKEYEDTIDQYQGKLARLTRKMHESGRSLLLVFEGPDAAGKGGTIRRLTQSMDARLYRVSSVAAPTDEERAHPYLWRFWRNLPRQGYVTIYDRSWYGRVLVERIEGFARQQDWQRAFSEINEFEEQLTEFGIIVIKFWLAISADEQLRRFKDREVTPFKQYKLTEEDWRNRDKWGAYEAAACDMIEQTSTDRAPWVLVEANDKYWARAKTLKTVTKRLKAELGGKG